MTAWWSRLGCTATALCAALAVASCNRGRIVECNALIDVANAQESALDNQMTRMNNAGGDASRTDDLARAFELARGRIQGVALTDAQLQALSRDYQSAIAQFVTVLQRMARAQREQDADTINRQTPDLQRIEQQSASVVGRINQYCQSL